MKNINTTALQYAPAISDDGLELYFTRASQLTAGSAAPGAVRIMVAARSSMPQKSPTWAKLAREGQRRSPGPCFIQAEDGHGALR
jgi:hypothetical protein